MRDTGLDTLRLDVRAFLQDVGAGGVSDGWVNSWDGFDRDFSLALGARGWIGMTWPACYGGHERSQLERYVVIEELLAAGAPVAAHWLADRQSGPLLLTHGTEHQRERYLPAMARGELTVAVGLSEPGAGSDLAAVRSRATPVHGGWRLNGGKTWSSHADRARIMIALVRTSNGERHRGLSQVIVDLAAPGVTVSPIETLAGERPFGEVTFDQVFIPSDALVGRDGEGWSQAMGELAWERSGPERFLSDIRLLFELVRALGASASPAALASLGRVGAHLATLRRMSFDVARTLADGGDATHAATRVKDLGAIFEQSLPEVVRLVLDTEAAARPPPLLDALMTYAVQHAPSFSIRGGGREVLRGAIARELGLR